MKQSAHERAWGFTPEEYIDALSRICSREAAEEGVSKIFRDLGSDSSQSVGGEEFLFALLSLVSQDCKRRILEITHWSDDELLRQQHAALHRSP